MNIQTTSLSGYTISYINEQELNNLHTSVFLDKEYAFESDKPDPLIIDGGAHIGMSVLYFKSIYPLSRIIAFEPNSVTFNILQKNIEQNNLHNVMLVNAALSDSDGTIDFYVSKNTEDPWTWGDAGVRNKWSTPENSNTIKVRSARLSRYLTEPISLLKLDVEGMENTVITEAQEHLSSVKQLIIEYHGSSTNPSNKIQDILDILKKKAFTYTLMQDGKHITEDTINKSDPFSVLIKASRDK